MGNDSETSELSIEDSEAYKLLASSDWKSDLNAPAPHTSPELYFAVALFTWGIPKPDQPEDICRRLESLQSLCGFTECPTKEDVMKIRKWLATDEVKKDLDLEQWAKDELDKDELVKALDKFGESLVSIS